MGWQSFKLSKVVAENSPNQLILISPTSLGYCVHTMNYKGFSGNTRNCKTCTHTCHSLESFLSELQCFAFTEDFRYIRVSYSAFHPSPQNTPRPKGGAAVRTRHVHFFGVGGAGRGGAGAVGQVARRAVVDVLHLGLQLAQPQHDVVQQHGERLLQVCTEEWESDV